MARASMERQVNGAMKGRSIFRDEKGSTTAGMAVALLVTLSLLFSAAQVYRIHAAGSEVQEVADAAACAALNPVAEFMVAVRVADAAVLSLTLLGDIAYGAGVVALCVPPAAELGSQLVSAGQKVLKARDALSQKACEGLGALQRALPFLAAANGAAVAAANGEGSGYAAMALLLPGEGSSIASGASVRSRSPWRRPWKRARASLPRRRPGPRRRRVPPRKPGLGVSPATAATIRPIACTSARGASQG